MTEADGFFHKRLSKELFGEVVPSRLPALFYPTFIAGEFNKRIEVITTIVEVPGRDNLYPPKPWEMEFTPVRKELKGYLEPSGYRDATPAEKRAWKEKHPDRNVNIYGETVNNFT